MATVALYVLAASRRGDLSKRGACVALRKHTLEETHLDSPRQVGMLPALALTMRNSILLSLLLGVNSLVACGGDSEAAKSADDADASHHAAEHADDAAQKAEDKADRAADKADQAAEDAQKAADK
jgi:hypothetical protein